MALEWGNNLLGASIPFMNSPWGGLMTPWGAPQWGWGAEGDTQSAAGGGSQASRNDAAKYDGGYGSPGSSSTPSGGWKGTDAIAAGQIAGHMANHFGKAALGGAALGMAGKAAGMSLGLGDVANAIGSGIANPAGLTSLGGRVVADQLGFSPSKSFAASLAQSLPGGLLSMVNPALGVAWGFASPFAADLVGDMADTRSDEQVKDAMEDTHGWLAGRRAAADLGRVAALGGFSSMGELGRSYGLSPGDMASGLSNHDASRAMRGQNPSNMGGINATGNGGPGAAGAGGAHDGAGRGGNLGGGNSGGTASQGAKNGKGEGFGGR